MQYPHALTDWFIFKIAWYLCCGKTQIIQKHWPFIPKQILTSNWKIFRKKLYNVLTSSRWIKVKIQTEESSMTLTVSIYEWRKIFVCTSRKLQKVAFIWNLKFKLSRTFLNSPKQNTTHANFMWYFQKCLSHHNNFDA